MVGLLVAVAWGLTRQEELSSLIRTSWERVPDLRNDRYVLAGLFPWEQRLYGGWLPASGKLALIGCGSGRDAIALAKAGYAVDGVDLSARLIQLAEAYAAKAGVRIKLSCADICTYEFADAPYEAVIFSYNSYAYIPGSARRLRLLARVRPTLSPNGCIILTYFSDPARQDSRLSRTAQWIGRVVLNSRPPEPGDAFSPTYYHFQHVFTPEEIRREAQAAGYEMIDVGQLCQEQDFTAAVLKPARVAPTQAGNSEWHVAAQHKEA